ncbi:MAG: histidine ammonia-lyase, partial [Mesorhizobium sp.]
MTTILTTREDINLSSVFRVAWKKDTVQISGEALQRIAECRASFLRLIETDPVPVIYGVTTAMGELASRRLEPGERGRHARIKAFAAATSFGEPLPDRVVRAIVLARLANFLEGNAATTPR